MSRPAGEQGSPSPAAWSPTRVVRRASPVAEQGAGTKCRSRIRARRH